MIKINNKIKEVIKRDKKVLFTTTREDFPFVVERGEGDYAYDIAGNRFIDFSSFIGAYNIGVNGNAEIRRAVKAQVDKLMHPAFLDYYSEPPVKFAENLLTLFPRGFGRVFYSNSGTEAIEDAIKLSKIFTKKKVLISFYGAFHGRSLGSLGLTASRTAVRDGLGPFPNIVHAIYPNPYRCQFNTSDPDDCAIACIDHIEKNILAKEYSSKEVAAIFFEPVQGEGGYIVPPKLFVKELRRVASENNILLVADEIQSGSMRTGKFLAMEHFGVTADIYTLAKSIGGGMPIGLTIAKTELGDTPPGSHAGTFGGNLVSVAAASSYLKYVKRNKAKLEAMSKEKSRLIMRRLGEMLEKYEIVGDVRGLGMMIAVEFVKSKSTKEPAVKERAQIIEKCFYNGLIMLPCGTSTIRIIPPLTMRKENIEKGLDILEQAISEVQAQ
jgi:4-aminobutyrate aminotransferase